jgi:transposase
MAAMPKPITIELRERAVAAYEAGSESYDVVAARFSVSRRSLQRWVERRRESGSVEPDDPAGGNYSRVDMKTLHGIVQSRPDATSYQVTSDYNRSVPRKKRVHRSSIVRALQRAGYVFKKSESDPPNKTGRT